MIEGESLGDEWFAWKKFTNSGKVSDYLDYIRLKNNTSDKKKGNNIYASSYKWPHNSREKYL